MFTKKEFKELLLTIMVGTFVRSGVLDSHGQEFKKIDDQLDFFLNLAEEYGYKDLIEYFENSKLPNHKLCHEEEEIMEEYNLHEFWHQLEIMFGQRDFFKSMTKEEKKEMEKEGWFPDRIEKYYEKYRNEFEEYGIDRLRIVDQEVVK